MSNKALRLHRLIGRNDANSQQQGHHFRSKAGRRTDPRLRDSHVPHEARPNPSDSATQEPQADERIENLPEAE